MACTSGSSILVEPYGSVDGRTVYRYTLSNSKRVQVGILSFGGIVQSINVPDRSGQIGNISLGFPSLEGYLEKHPYFGTLVGRVANRIKEGKFELDGQTYQLAINNGPNHLHGGLKGFDKCVWDSKVEEGQLVLSLVSGDGEENYPGECRVEVRYSLNDDNELTIDYRATSSKATPINLTNHTYFNLAGQDTGVVYDHVVRINADHYLPVDDTSIPTGEIAPVEGTPFDLRTAVQLGPRIDALPNKGFDHTFRVNAGDTEKKFTARVEHPASGRVLEVYTTQPGVQFYTGNYLATSHVKHGGFCLETQAFPNAINKPNFPSCVLRPGQTFHETTWYRFQVNA